jgi:hypothetical protein
VHNRPLQKVTRPLVGQAHIAAVLGGFCRRRGRLCMQSRWGRSVRCGPGHWSVTGLPGPAKNSGVCGQNSWSVLRGGRRHRVLLQVLHARMDMGTSEGSVHRRSLVPSRAVWLRRSRKPASPRCSARYERSPWPIGAGQRFDPGRPARGPGARSSRGQQPVSAACSPFGPWPVS